MVTRVSIHPRVDLAARSPVKANDEFPFTQHVEYAELIADGQRSQTFAINALAVEHSLKVERHGLSPRKLLLEPLPCVPGADAP